MRFIRLFLLLLPPLMVTTESLAGACVPQTETIKKHDDSTEMIRYLCSANPGKDAPTLRISFYRLDEALAGSVVTSVSLPELQTAVGPFLTVDNDVAAEARTLFQQYGSQRDYDFANSDVSWNIDLNDTHLESAVDQVDDTSAKRKKSSARPRLVRHIRYLSGAFSLTDTSPVLGEIENTLLHTTRWPAGYKFFFAGCDDDFISCTTLWRYITASDFDLLLQDMRDYVRKTIAKVSDRSASPIVSDYERSFQLERYLAQNGMPPDFLSVYTGIEQGCVGDGWSFMYSGRPLTVDVAIIENLTDQPIRIDDFRGLASTEKGLRPVSKSVALAKDNPVSLKLPPQSLDAHARLLLPIRIKFGAAGLQDGDLDTAKATYEKIKTSNDTIFEHQIQITPEKKITVRKAKESFAEPEAPADTEYLFGPEISLGGLVADGKEFALQVVPEQPQKKSTADDSGGADADKSPPAAIGKLSFSIWVGPDQGGISCPILYYREEASGSWITLGKVLDQANGADKEMTQIVPLPYLQTHFRLNEEEPEVSYINDAVLRLTLADARRVEVRARQAYSRIISAYTSSEIDFDLPEGVSASDVVTSEIILSGYYERYDRMLSLVRNRATPAARD
jgi:hypothetical protein